MRYEITEHKQLPFKRITIIGVGLIGGSLALSVKQRYPTIHITGLDKPRVLKLASARHAIDIAARSIAQAVRSADLVILAVPVSAILKLLPAIAKDIAPHAIVTDTGSVKQGIVRQAERFFPQGNFIGGHPMAGSEFSGINAAHPLLFQNAIYILTPTRTTKKQSLRHLSKFYASLGARLFTMDAGTHDSVVAAVSHLPQLAAVALMSTVGRHHPNSPNHLALAAGGFRDMTRIASSQFEMWNEILSANQKEVKKALLLYIKRLQILSAVLDSHPTRLASEFQISRKLRSRIPRSMKGFHTPLVELSVFVEDKPGQLARLTAALGKRKINIKDLELLKVREGRGGTFRLSFENRSVATDAARTLQQAGFEVVGKW